MQNEFTAVQARPFAKLAQSNMSVLADFSTSPEVASLVAANATQLYQQSAELAMKLMQSSAYSHVLQGMWKNYVEFIADVGQNWMAVMHHGHEALTVQAPQEAAGEASPSIAARRSRAR